MNKLDQFGQVAQNVDSPNEHVVHGDPEQHPPRSDDYEDEVVDWEEDDSQHMDNEDSTDEIESEQGGSVLDSFAPPKSQFIPTDLNKKVWNRVTKLSSYFNDEEWRKFSTNSLVKKWSVASQAVAFSAPKPDPGLVDLHFQDQKDLEKQLVAAQKTTGAAGAVSTKILERIEGHYC